MKEQHKNILEKERVETAAITRENAKNKITHS